ncbi:MAG: TatD family hydrolase [Candidatus Nomurabacteria bacterium]|jgi:TatD DNase family protein|nr:TatD family hydrolase [Candidatus Nomurabacteria bacterium]
MLVDTHCHIHDVEIFSLDPAETVERAKLAGVTRMIVIGTCPSDAKRAQEFAAKYDGVFWSYGYHPNEAEEALEFFKDDKLVSIGEIGLDYHYGRENRLEQIKRFEMMLDLAEREKLPVNFHVREAFEDFWPIVDNFRLSGAVLHSFSDSEENLKEGLNRGMYMGVNGLATFAKISLPPLERMVLETDAPFLTPVPLRGKINEPSYVKNIADWVAAKYERQFDEVAAVTTANAEKLFNL